MSEGRRVKRAGAVMPRALLAAVAQRAKARDISCAEAVREALVMYLGMSRPRRPKWPPEDIILPVRLPPLLAAAVDERARQEAVSRSALIRRALERWLDTMRKAERRRQKET